MSKTPEKLTFEGTVASNYYAYMNNYDGYGGFNFLDVITWGKGFLDSHKAFDGTGYLSALHGNTEVFTLPGSNIYGGYGAGTFYSVSTETFDLKSGVFASAWETNQPVQFMSYVLNHKGQFVLKATDTVYLSQTATTIDFGKYGNDFKNIAGFKILSTRGSAGVYSNFYHNVTYGYEIAMDNVKVKWHGTIPHNHHPVHHVAPALHIFARDMHHAVAAHAASSTSHGYHSELATLASEYHHSGSLAQQFSLPHIDHAL
ncbi:MAG TPA: hypothetical protein VGF97_11060 [Rhizomicrobium sp.]|jgi:hypothetical protein